MNTLHQAVAVAVAASSLLMALPSQASVEGATPEDKALARQVETALKQAVPLQDRGTDIHVKALDGKVVLSGWVTHDNDAALAARVAQSVAGVRSVAPSLRSWSSDADYRVGVTYPPLQVRPQAMGSEQDQALAAEVKRALMAAPPFQDSDVDISVVALDGQVKLSGWVSYANDEQAARQIAQSVAGVQKVSSDLRSWSTDTDARVARAATAIPSQPRTPVQPKLSDRDQALADEIKQALAKAAPFQERGVDISVVALDGTVDLSGWVNHVNDDAAARKIAATVPGVRQVHSHLRSWSTEER